MSLLGQFDNTDSGKENPSGLKDRIASGIPRLDYILKGGFLKEA